MAARNAWDPWACRLLDGFFLVFGAWTLLCWIVAFAGASFHTLVALSWLPLLLVAAAALLPWARVAPHSAAASPASGAAGEEPLEPRLLALAAALAGGVALLYHLTGSYTLFWVLAVALLYGALRKATVDPAASSAADVATTATTDPADQPASPRGARWKAFVLLALCAVAVTVTLAAHRPDPDDSFYLNLVVTALDHPADPLLAHDGLYGERNLPPIEPWYLLKSYEPLVATVSQLLPIDPKTLYYLIFPAFFALLLVVANEAALRDLGGGAGAPAAVGTAIVVLVLVAWGDVHQAFGNFSFVRLYQGKAVMVAVCVPAVVHYAARFARRRDPRGWLLLGLSQVAALGISGSAVVAIPTTVLAFLAGWMFANRRSAVLYGLAASLLALAFAAVILTRMPFERQLALSWAEIARLPADSAGGLAAVLGAGPRRTYALFGLLLAPLLAPPGRRRIVLGYVLALLLLVMNPFVPAYAGRIVHRFTWRLFWSVPFPLLLGLCGQRLAALGGSSPAIRRWPAIAPALALAWGAAFALLPGTWTLSPVDRTRLGMPTLKVMPEHALAAALVATTAPRDLVLAPYEIAQWVPTFRHHPRLIAVRPNYFSAVAGEGNAGIDERRRLQALVGGPTLAQPPAAAAPPAGTAPPAAAAAEMAEATGVADGLALVARRAVDVLVVNTNVPWHSALAAGLRHRGCALAAEPPSPHYELWRCPRPAATPVS